MGSGMAMTSGVNMKLVGSVGTVRPPPDTSARRLTMAPHELAAGDHSTGSVPSAWASHSPSDRASAARPEDTEVTSTRTQSSPVEVSAKSDASCFIRSIFSELTEAGTLVQLSSADSPPPPPPQADASRPAAASAASVRALGPSRRAGWLVDACWRSFT